MTALERLLERIVMRAIDTNEHITSALATGVERPTTRLSYRDTFLRLAELGVYSKQFVEQIAPSAGLCNVLVHEYNDVDHRLVHSSIRDALGVYPSYVQQVRRFIDEIELDNGPT